MKQVAAAVIAFLLLLLVHSSSSTKSYSTASNWPSASLVDDVCKKSDTTYGDCVSTLESDPRTRTASDLRSLARIVLETAHANTTKSKEHFEILAKSSMTAPDLMAEGGNQKTEAKMKAETKAKIEDTVREILVKSDMTETTEFQIRKQASEKMGLDLSQPEYKAFVRHVVTTFLEEQDQKSKEEQEEEEEEENEAVKNDNAEYDDEGNLIICQLNKKRRVTIQDFKGKTLVSIREYYTKGGKELPSAKGISLTEEQWSALRKNVSAIDTAVKKMQSRIM